MKKILVLLLTLLPAACLHAQSSSRLIAFAGWDNDTTVAPNDTGGYAYANGRGGQISTQGFDFGPLMSFKCDFPFVLVPGYDFETGHSGSIKYDSAWESSHGSVDKSFQTFDAGNNIVYAVDLYLDSTAAWQNNRAASYDYDAYHNLVSKNDWSYSAGMPYIVNQYLYSYDSYNRLTSEVSKIADTALKTKALYTYDATGNLVGCKGERWNNATSAWDSQSYIHFYYAGTKVDTFKMASGGMGLYYFSPANDTMILNRGNILITRTYDAYHNQTSLTYLVVDSTLVPSFIKSFRVDWSYNSFNQIIAERNYNQDSLGNWIFSGMHRYYYELYTSGINETASASNIQLYPNPATNQVTITSPDKIFSISINNLVGQTVLERICNSDKVLVDVANLPSGIYLVKVNGSEVQKFVKQ